MSLLRVTSFRAALGFTLILSLVLAVVLGALYERLQARLLAVDEARVWREAASLNRIYTQAGVRGLAEAINGQAQAGQGLALHLSDSLGVYLAGNVTGFPAPDITSHSGDGWFDFNHLDVVIRARLLALDSDLVLLIGYDRADSDRALADMRGVFALSLFGLLLVGLMGAALLARHNLARVAAMNKALQPVMDGYLDRRIPQSDRGDEWGLMAAHINTVLARLERVIYATREVSDNLAHDLRAPLTRLKMRLEAVMEKADEAQLDQLSDAQGDVDALLRSFNALLALSRLESGIMQLTRKPFDAAAMLENLHALFDAVFEAQGMRLDMQLNPVSGVSGDEALLSQAVVNGLENILAHAARPNSTAVLSLTDAGEAFVITLADEGDGIGQADRARAVERFVRLDESRHGDGSGLGLSLIAAICRHHGGTLELQDNTPGLRLIMRLPKSGNEVG